MKTILLDDEPYCLDVLTVLLSEYCPSINIVAQYNDPVKALEAIQESPPDLLFLDIEMPRMNGFELLHRCTNIPFKVIFTTAYDKYAVRAFRFCALDYLLKPIDKTELIAAVHKATQPQPILQAQQLALVQQHRINPTPDRIALPTATELVFTDVKDIIHCESDGSYTTFFIKGDSTTIEKVMVSKSLREIEELLNSTQFFRSHQSHLIHLQHIKKVLRNDGSEIVMSDGRSIPIARSKKQEFLALIQKL
jgi:two-component system, LytTR family, response regulator